jgi:hypothetical protein
MENNGLRARENMKQEKTQREMDGQSNNDGLTEEETGDRDMWGHLVYCTVDRPWGGWMEGRMGECTTDRTRQAMDCNVTSRRVRITTVAMEKQ